jgi:glycosyltransferase involved in cell wall biosynthesis
MPLKILFLSHKFFPDIGGIEANSEILANEFVKAGHQVRLMTWSEDTTRKQFPFEIIRNPGKRLLFKQHAWADIVFENNPCLQMSWPAVFYRRPLVIALHTWIGSRNLKTVWQDRIKFIWFKRAKKIIAVSEALRKACWPAATVIGNPYNEEIFKIMPDIGKTRAFVFLGRLVSDKGADLAIKAIHLLKEKNPSASYSLTIIGDGQEKDSLENLAADLDINDRIFFTGSLKGTELAKTLNQHRFVLVPSLWEEPFGMVALEGMACGCVPIVSDGGGLPEAIGKAGLSFHRGDVNDLFVRIKEILNHPDLEHELLEAAEEHLAGHKAKVISKKYLEIIEAAGKN